MTDRCSLSQSTWDLGELKGKVSTQSVWDHIHTQRVLTGWEKVTKNLHTILFYFFPFIFISWRLITLQYCSGFCHTLTWISHGFTCVPHPNPPSHLPAHNFKIQAGRIISEHHCPAANCIPPWCPTSFTWPPWSLPHLWVYMCPP